MERNNIYAGTPPKVKSVTLIPKLQPRKPPIPVRTDSTRSVSSTTTTPTTTPSNSFRLMSRSVDTSSYGLTKNGIDDIETLISNGNFLPLQSVKEDESLEIDKNNNHEKYSKVNRF